jgi:hypothetical protein
MYPLSNHGAVRACKADADDNTAGLQLFTDAVDDTLRLESMQSLDPRGNTDKVRLPSVTTYGPLVLPSSCHCICPLFNLVGSS